MLTLRNYYPILSFILMLVAATAVGFLYWGSYFVALGYDTPEQGVMSPFTFAILGYFVGTLVLLLSFLLISKLFAPPERWSIIRNCFLIYVVICFYGSLKFLINPNFSGSLNIPFHAENAYKEIVESYINSGTISAVLVVVVALHIASLSFLYFSLKKLLAND